MLRLPLLNVSCLRICRLAGRSLDSYSNTPPMVDTTGLPLTFVSTPSAPLQHMVRNYWTPSSGSRRRRPTSVDTFFEAVERNLKDGEVRIIFFLEKAPNELKNLVEFLN